VGSSGTTLLLVAAAILWLIYLVPLWLKRSEYYATERNATRLGQTLRLLANTSEVSEEITAELKARSIAKKEKEAQRQLRILSSPRTHSCGAPPENQTSFFALVADWYYGGVDRLPCRVATGSDLGVQHGRDSVTRSSESSQPGELAGKNSGVPLDPGAELRHPSPSETRCRKYPSL